MTPPFRPHAPLRPLDSNDRGYVLLGIAIGLVIMGIFMAAAVPVWGAREPAGKRKKSCSGEGASMSGLSSDTRGNIRGRSQPRWRLWSRTSFSARYTRIQ